MLPIASRSIDTVIMLGGIHHVSDRTKLFSEVARIMKPAARFYYREPVSDFFLWRAIRSIVRRLSPILDHATERPLLYRETIPVITAAGLRPIH
jgi:ubiquinone/menaquinone biosynthesis C-methylase UbiE